MSAHSGKTNISEMAAPQRETGRAHMFAARPGPQLLNSVEAIAHHFDLFLIDQFGVLHDGLKPFAGTIDLLRRLRQQGKRVVVLTNSAKPAEANGQRLARLGFSADLFDRVLTSGDLARRNIAAGKLAAPFRPGARVFVVGREGGEYHLDAAGLHAVRSGEPCDFVLFAGSSVPDIGVEAYRRELAPAAEARIPGLCCNPDLTMLTPSGLQPGCGALAQLYRGLGGTIVSVGKPEASFFQEARELFDTIPPSRTLVIGDSLEHDILGGKLAGFGTALVRTGVHQQLRYAELVKRMHDTRAVPDFVLASLTWSHDPQERATNV